MCQYRLDNGFDEQYRECREKNLAEKTDSNLGKIVHARRNANEDIALVHRGSKDQMS